MNAILLVVFQCVANSIKCDFKKLSALFSSQIEVAEDLRDCLWRDRKFLRYNIGAEPSVM